MSPWDEYGWFESPKQTTHVLNAGSTLNVAPFNVRRVVLIIMPPIGGSVHLGIVDSTSLTVGYTMGPTDVPFVMTQKDHGPIVQASWFCVPTGAGTTLTVIEQLLRDWPKGGFDGHQDLAQIIAQSGVS